MLRHLSQPVHHFGTPKQPFWICSVSGIEVEIYLYRATTSKLNQFAPYQMSMKFTLRKASLFAKLANLERFRRLALQ